MSHVRKILRFVVACVVFYGLSVLIGCVVYRRILFPAPGNPPPIPPGVGEPLTAKTSDGVIANALYFAAQDANAPVVVFFHGNGESVSYDLWRAQIFQSLGFGALLAEYRGYGTAAANGSPTEAGLYADAEAEISALEARHVPKNRVALWGFSLGTGVATEMAARGHGCALVLEAPFTSILDMADHVTPFLPNAWIVTDRFDSFSKAPKIASPSLVLHGDADEVVPFAMGEKLAHAIPRAKFIHVSGGHHTNLLDVDGDEIERAAQTLVNSACRDPAPK